MAVTTKKSLLFLAGGVAAAAIVAYTAGAIDPFFKRQPQIAELSPGEGQGTPAALSSAAPQQPATAESLPQKASSEGAAEPEVVPPSFDVLRLQGDGSIVIAGKAASNAWVDLLVGSNVIGSTTAGAEGDFAVALDEPLKSGDYQIVLRSTTPENVVAMSVETAVVSVPETPEGQVLALVEEPGKPSEMITLPKPQKPAAQVKSREAPAEKPAAATALPQKPSDAALSGDAASQEKAQAATASPPAEEQEATAPAAEAQVAALPAETKPEPAPATPQAKDPKVRVEAVEIDGRRIFVAGTADPDRIVRGYANQILLGDAKVSSDGRFLIEAERDLPVGDYIIRIDALEADGVKVAARAAVPFEREPGETIAAVAAPEPARRAEAVPEELQQAQPQPEAAQPTVAMSPPVAGTPEELTQPSVAEVRPNTGSSSGAPAGVAKAPAGVVDEPASSGLKGQPAIGSNVEQPASETGAVAERPADPSRASAQELAELSEAVQQKAPETGAPAVSMEAGEEAADQPVAPPAAAETDVAAAPPESTALPSADDVTEVLAPKLKSVDSAVIIRRGDTLWRISRRVYGRGIRYSTIYLANEDQIEDPDRIWPGQVFKVPEKSADGQAEADYSTLGSRLTTVPAEGDAATE